ncbi:C40 family peptidase [Bifidobacterium simiarum]|uniref:C40 family peptidase n=1 Tax=Bifidobacterium simiarum TaxID=2045441 RepID=UPI001BDC5F69|nr:NlpC/P60 family protein [Bifidobacterium simiarum]MBT1167210.1 C40 family peptidase [Bifidobacterium simiarum]
MRRIVSIAAAVAMSGTLISFTGATASAAEDGAVTSSRSFTPQKTRDDSLLKESTATSVKTDDSYGGIETLNVPKTQSKAERDAAEAKKKAQEQAQQNIEAASRSSERSAQSTTSSASGSTGASTTSSSASSSSSTDSTSDESAATADSGAAEVSESDNTFVGRAMSVIGSAYRASGYVWTGSTSSSAFTCSGLVDYALGLPTNSNTPEGLYAKVSGAGNMKHSTGSLAYGDLVFFDYAGRHPGHVGIYIGNGLMVDSAGSGVAVRAVSTMPFIGGGALN